MAQKKYLRPLQEALAVKPIAAQIEESFNCGLTLTCSLPQRKYLRPLQEALVGMRAPAPEVALRPEAAWRPLQRVLDAMHAQLR